MDGSIKIVEIGSTLFWEMDLLPPISALAPEDVDDNGDFDDRIPVTFEAPITVASRKKAA